MNGKNIKRRRAEHIRRAAACLALAAALLAVCSRSSPLYPFNYWVDANCFFTVGKSMAHGLVPYRDLYEQKGPLLYALHGLAYLISRDGFLGAWLLEVLFFAAFLLGTMRILRLYTSRVPYLVPAALGAAVAASNSFGLGDSAEELCLPLVSWSLYFLLRLLSGPGAAGEGKQRGAVALNGFFAGCVLWIKFSMLGFHLGWIAVLCLTRLRQKGLGEAVRTGAAFLTGMLAASLPWILYFGLNHSLESLWTVYFYNNIFLYSIPSGSLTAGILSGIRNLAAGLRQNPGYAVPALAGLLWVLLCPRSYLSTPARTGVFTTFLLLAAGVYAGGRAYAYYALILSVYGVLGFLPVLLLVQRAEKGGGIPAAEKRKGFLSALGLVLCLLLAFRFANDAGEMGQDRSELVQYQFGRVMHQMSEAPTLLNYRFLDGGFYTAGDIVPNCRYFCVLNIPLGEMWDAQDAYLREGRVEFVVTKDEKLDTLQFPRYRYVCEGAFRATGYFLYRRSG